MTHNELLQAINDKLAYYTNNNFGASGFAIALRAVVELHKPIEGHEHLCGACWFGDGMMSYPCPTIQVLEKELG